MSMERYILKGSSKGQLSSLDLVVASLLFLSIILLFVWSWGELNNTIWSYEYMQHNRDLALDMTDVLLHTQGNPTYWEALTNISSANVKSIGLVSEPGILDINKIDALKNMPVAESARILGHLRGGYSIKISVPGTGVITRLGEEKDALSVVQRPAILEDRVVVFELRIYEGFEQ